MLNVRGISTIAGVALLAAPVLLQSAAAEAVEFKFHTFVPPVANPIKTFYGPWAKHIEEVSGGKIKITIYPAMQLGGAPPQLADQVKDGVVDMVWTLPSYSTGRFPKTEAIEQPFVHTNALATTLALQDFYDKHLKDEYKDFHMLLIHTHEGEFIQSKRPVRKVSDLKGLKIRVLNKTAARFFGSLGASPIGAPLPEIPQMLAKGVIDAALIPYEIAPAIKMQELVNYFCIMEGEKPRIHTGVFTFLMNKKSYDGLSPDLRKILDDNSGRNIAAKAGQNWRDIEAPARKIMLSKEKNKEIIMPASEVAKLQKAAQPAIHKWIEEMTEKGYNGQELYDDAVAMIEKYTKTN